jgi:hypothetical protein
MHGYLFAIEKKIPTRFVTKDMWFRTSSSRILCGEFAELVLLLLLALY